MIMFDPTGIQNTVLANICYDFVLTSILLVWFLVRLPVVVVMAVVGCGVVQLKIHRHHRHHRRHDFLHQEVSLLL